MPDGLRHSDSRAHSYTLWALFCASPCIDTAHTTTRGGDKMKDRVIVIRLSLEERRKLEVLARRTDRCMSSVVRILIAQAGAVEQKLTDVVL